MPKQPADPVATARQLLESSGLEAARLEVGRLEANHNTLRERLMELTRKEHAAKQQTYKVDLGDLDALIASDDGTGTLREQLAEVHRDIRKNAEQVKAARQHYAALLKNTEPQIRDGLMAGNADLSGKLFLSLIDLARQYRDLLVYQTDAEALVNGANLRGLPLEAPFPGIRGRLLGDSLVQEAFLLTLAAEWLERGLLTGQPAEQVRSYVKAERADLERKRQARAEYEAAADRQNKIDALAWRRQALADGRLQYLDRHGHPMRPAAAVERFDKIHAGTSIPRPEPVLAGEMLSR